MSQWIDGVHHIALKPTAEQYEKTVEFYTQLLGFCLLYTSPSPRDS